MRWLLVVLSVGLALLGFERTSLACMNATMSENEAVRKLKEAEAALDQGDVVTARELAHDVHYIYRYAAPESSNPLVIRAARVEALSYVRDRDASEADLANAVQILRRWVDQKGELPGTLAPLPPLLADYGEALERTGQNDEAWNVLLPLASKDLIGSAYAYAALSRAAKAKGEAADAAAAMTRCETIAVNPGMCRGEYPKRPFLRARPIDLSVIGVLFLGLALVRLVRKKQPWSTHRAPMFAGFVLLAGAGAFFFANHRVGWAAILDVLPLLFLGYAQRGQWMKAVRRGEIAGFCIRRIEEDEEKVPLQTLWFLDGPRAPEVLERTIDPAYRDSAKAPALFRLQQNRVSFGGLVTAGVVFAVLAGCALVLMTLTRGI